MGDWFEVKPGDRIKVYGRHEFFIQAIDFEEPPFEEVTVTTLMGNERHYPLSAQVEVTGHDPYAVPPEADDRSTDF